jgi:hypothetical protein
MPEDGKVQSLREIAGKLLALGYRTAGDKALSVLSVGQHEKERRGSSR